MNLSLNTANDCYAAVADIDHQQAELQLPAISRRWFDILLLVSQSGTYRPRGVRQPLDASVKLAVFVHGVRDIHIIPIRAYQPHAKSQATGPNNGGILAVPSGHSRDLRGWL